jgi:hypothetical protein
MVIADEIGSFGDIHRTIGVDTIIRFHDLNAIGELDRAVFSLFHQSYTSVCPIVVTQGFDESALLSVRSIVERYNWTSKEVRPLVINVENSDNRDIRSKLLNVGLRASTGRYFSILDADDYLYGHALHWLVSNLRNGKFAISFGDIVLKNLAVTSGISYCYGRQSNLYKGNGLRDLLSENFCPIHSFVVDKRSIEQDDLCFNEEISRLEDYDFLLRICSRYEANFASRSKAVGVYNWKWDGSNSTVVGSESGPELKRKQIPWDAARKQIEITKRMVLERLGL